MQYHQLTRMPYSSSVLLLCPRVTKNTILLSLGSDDDYQNGLSDFFLKINEMTDIYMSYDNLKRTGQ